jgi:hypothetical protein
MHPQPTAFIRRSAATVVADLDAAVLASLFHDEVSVIIVKNFASPPDCDRFSALVRTTMTATPYTHEVYEDGTVKHLYFGVDRVGVPFNSTLTRENIYEATERYYSEALPAIRRIRSAWAPNLSPIDRLRLELDEQWPVGAHVAAFHGRSMFIGIVRVMQPASSDGSELFPHFDALPRAICPFEAQFAANVFMAVPPVGGELELWDVPPLEPGAVLPADWRTIGGEAVAIKPQVGDLIIFNSRKPHAVRRFVGSDRVSLQTFIGYREGLPLLLWN